MQCFINEVKAAVLQVTQPAVNQLGRRIAGAGGEVSFVDQAHPEGAEHAIQGDAGSGDSAADDQEIEEHFPEGVDSPFHQRILAIQPNDLA